MMNNRIAITNEEQELISAGELADMAGVALQSVLNYVKRGDIVPAVVDSSGRAFFRKEQIVTVSFLKKGRSSMCNNILCLCFSDNQGELTNYEEKAVEFFKTYQPMKEEKSLSSSVDIFKECSKRTSNNTTVGIKRIDDFESAYISHIEANESAVINSSDFLDEIDKLIANKIMDNVADYKLKRQRGISKCRDKGMDTSFQESNLAKDIEIKRRELISASETPEFRELFIQRKGNALKNKRLWNSFEKEYLNDGYYSLKPVLVSDDRKEFTDILSFILRGEYKQVFILGYDSIPDVIEQVLQALESLHKISVVKEF